jgi:hypothetical protein
MRAGIKRCRRTSFVREMLKIPKAMMPIAAKAKARLRCHPFGAAFHQPPAGE